jgi:hypothetical protein
VGLGSGGSTIRDKGPKGQMDLKSVNDYILQNNVSAAKACRALNVPIKRYYYWRGRASEKMPNQKDKTAKVTIIDTPQIASETKRTYNKKTQTTGKIAIVIGSISDVTEILKGLN